MSRSVLLTVSGVIPSELDVDVAAGRRPRADYRVLAEQLHADVVDAASARRGTGAFGRLVDRVAGVGPLIAWRCFRTRRDYDVVVTDGEQVGIPFAMLCRLFGRRGSRHVMIVHILSVPKKAMMISWFRLSGLIDRYVVYCTAQRDFILRTWGVDTDAVVQMPFMVDTRFFTPVAAGVGGRPVVCSAGLERRDYPTMMDAVADLDADVVIAAASPWSKRRDTSDDRVLPPNVTIERLSLFDLRTLYARSGVVVMPLEDVDFQAGITTILEAMAMGKPVVCSRSTGQTDTIIDGVTGVYCAPGDAEALNTAITGLIDRPEDAERIGQAARRWVVDHADIEVYAARLGQVVDALTSA